MQSCSPRHGGHNQLTLIRRRQPAAAPRVDVFTDGAAAAKEGGSIQKVHGHGLRGISRGTSAPGNPTATVAVVSNRYVPV